MNLPGFQGSVSILTVHKAKGLEFPIVFLPGMNQAARSLTIGPEALISESGNGPRVAIKDANNPVYNDMWKGDSGEREEIKREQQRLLYVAMTRARDHLIMLGTLGNNKSPVKQSSWLDDLHTTAPQPLFASPVDGPTGVRSYAYPVSAREPGFTVKTPSAPHSQGGVARGISMQIDVQRVLNNISPIPRSDALEWKRATDFIEREREDAAGTVALSGEGRGVSPLIRGSILHRCLEEYTKNGAYDIDRITAEYPEIMTLGHDAQHTVKAAIESILRSVLGNNAHCMDIRASSEGILGTALSVQKRPYPRERHHRSEYPEIMTRGQDAQHTVKVDVELILRSVLGNGTIAWIFERQQHAYSELPFLYKKGHSLVSGIIDRVVVKDGKGSVIDYKSIVIESNETLDEWKEHYRPQLAIYCEAVKDIFKLESVEGYLLFLDSNRLVHCTGL